MLKWTVQNNQRMSEPPQPRLCHIRKWSHFDGFGFTLHSDKTDGSQIIGKIDEDSPAAAGGLKPGDKIIEINGVNVTRENHKQVVERIKSGGEETRLLVADKECQEYHNDQDIVIRSSLPYILHLSSEQGEESSSEEEDEEEPRKGNNIHEDFDSDEVGDELSNDIDDVNDSIKENVKTDKMKNMLANYSPHSSSDEEVHSPRENLSSQGQTERNSYKKDELVAGLNLNMTAREMRMRLGSVKKTDPRINQMDLREKYEMVNSL